MFHKLKNASYLAFYLSTEIPNRLVLQDFGFFFFLRTLLYALLLALSCSAVPL